MEVKIYHLSDSLDYGRHPWAKLYFGDGLIVPEEGMLGRVNPEDSAWT